MRFGQKPFEAYQVAQWQRICLPMQETWVRSLDCEDALEEEGFHGSSVGKKSICSAGDPGLISGPGRSPGEGIGYPLQQSWASLMAQLVKNPPAMQDVWIRSLDWVDPLERRVDDLCQYSGMENSTDSIVHGVTKSWTRLSDFHFPGRGNYYPLQYPCLGNPHGQRSLADYSPWGCKEPNIIMHTHPLRGPLRFLLTKILGF